MGDRALFTFDCVGFIGFGQCDYEDVFVELDFVSGDQFASSSSFNFVVNQHFTALDQAFGLPARFNAAGFQKLVQANLGLFDLTFGFRGRRRLWLSC